MIVKNYKRIVMSNNSLNPAHTIVIAQAKLQLKDKLRVAISFRLAHICRPQMCIP